MYIQELSKEVGLSKKAINLYEKRGFIQPVKDNLGYRDYTTKEIKTLQKIKQLRNLGFTLSQIQDVLIDNNYKIFDEKKDEYLKQYYELDTSIQYIEDMKEAIINNEDIDSLSQEMDHVFDLKNIKPKHKETIDFEKWMFPMFIFSYTLVLFEAGDTPITVIATIIYFIALSLSSINTQSFIYEIIKKIKK